MQPQLSWLAHLQLLDSALPVGAFSHSFGLETLVARGEITDVRGLEAFLEAMLHGSWAPVDALLIKGAYTLETADLWELDRRVDASRPARETRDGLRKMGRQMLRLCRSMHPELELQALEAAVRSSTCPGTWPLVYGCVARELGVPLPQAATGYLYACCAAATGNCVRMSLLGQTAAQTLLAAILPEVLLAWGRVEDRAPSDFCSAVPRVEVAQMEHETLPARLFMS